MYFSGNMLDEYTRHLELLDAQPISEIVDEDAEPVERAYVKIVGMITSVTTKNTKNGDRMAFFTVEDRMGEIECVAFARQFAEMSHMIRRDSGVYVCGNISLREDEAPKILVHRMEELVENNRFRAEDVAPRDRREKAESSGTKPSPAVTNTPEPVLATARRLFLRVPDNRGREYCKAINLVELFEGEFPTFFYYADEKRYETLPMGVYLSDYVLRELKGLLGDENVILK